jgi:hypothetical protein
MDWFTEAKKLYKPGIFGYRKIAKELNIPYKTVESRFRDAKRRGELNTTENEKVQINGDGTVISQKFIKLKEGQNLAPKEILAIHGFNPELWEVVNCINNFWNSQLKGGALQISYQSKLTAKPTKQGLDFAAIKKQFETLDRKYERPIISKVQRNGHLMAEVNIADLHVGKLCWHGDTGNNYDHKIAKQIYYQILSEICEELKSKQLEYITFVWSNDFFNSDTIEQTTTAGTRQDTDVRWQKLFNVGVEMLVTGVDMLASIAPVKTFRTASNHDEVSGYHALQYLAAWFRNDPRVEISTEAKPRHYQLYGNTLIGYCHGDKENSRGTKEKASRLASLMPLEAKDFWAKAQYREMHAAHLHSEQMIQEINGVIVRRISSPTATDTYHNDHGYIGAVRKAQTFIYDKQRGLTQIINTPVEMVAEI